MSLIQLGTGSGGAKSWMWQRISGIILVITLFLHYLFLHFLNGGIVTYGEVTSRLASPLWKTIDIVFLSAALYHAATGVIMSIHDYVHKPGWRMTLVIFTWIVATILWLTGIMTVATVEVY